jgi:hypothetical protein
MANNERGTDDPYSASCGAIEGPFCQSASAVFQFEYRVDTTLSPRPRPFVPGRVYARFAFTPSGESSGRVDSREDPSPKDGGPGKSLEPAFSRRYEFSSARSGNLHVELGLHDPATSPAVYVDDINVIVRGCV